MKIFIIESADGAGDIFHDHVSADFDVSPFFAPGTVLPECYGFPVRTVLAVIVA